MTTTPSTEKPATAEELARRLHEAAESHLAVVPVGGGRAAGMGNAPVRCDLLLHTTLLDRVLEHSQPDMVVSVEAGITLEHLQGQLGNAGQFLPLDPHNSPGHTVGGLLATGWTGPLRLRYGSARDFLIGIRVALPDGKLVSAGGRVVKNVSGYDMMKLHHGALGSLGVIVAASFKVFPKPLHDVTVEMTPGSIDQAWAAADSAFALPLPPAALELFSDGRVLGRFQGSVDGVNRMVRELGWRTVDEQVWGEHSRRAPTSWARIAAPRSALRGVIAALPAGAEWWASPGIGLAHWSFGQDVGKGAESIGMTRTAAEAAGGSLVLLDAPREVVDATGAWGTPPPNLELMQRLKHQFDPNGTLNPGRFLV